MKKHLIPVFGFIFVFHFASIAQIFILQPDGDEGKDTEIWSHAGPLSVLGDRESINVYTWTNQGMLAHKRALIEFDLSPFNPNMGLIKALLSIYYNPSDIHESVDVHSGDNAVFIERIISEWTEHGPTWASQPATTTQNRIELPPSSSHTQDYIDIDVTDLVNDMLDDPDNSHGFMIKMQNETTPYRMLLFASSDHPNPALRPKLELEFKGITSTEPTVSRDVDFVLYPNPIDIEKTGKVIIESPVFQNGQFRYIFVDALGRLIQKGEIFSSMQEIDLGFLEKSVYLFWIVDKPGLNAVKKLVVK
jgi:hypothetical protein